MYLIIVALLIFRALAASRCEKRGGFEAAKFLFPLSRDVSVQAVSLFRDLGERIIR